MRSTFGRAPGRRVFEVLTEGQTVRTGPENKRVVALAIAAGALLSAGLFPGHAAAESYTKCTVPSDYYANQSQEYCIPAPGAAQVRETIRIGKNPAHEHLVLALPARNCRGPSGVYRGDMVLLLDSSQSLEKTDPTDERMEGTDGFIEDVRAETEGDPLFPRLGVISYGGRLRFQRRDPDRPGRALYQGPVAGAEQPEAWSPVFDNVACLDGDDAEVLKNVFPQRDGREPQFGPFSSRDSELRWNERVQTTDPYPLSICEFLRLVSVGTDSTEPTTPGLTRQKNFLRVAQGSPRGATDVSYMLDTIAGPTLLGQAPTESARHAIVITDGLPNTPVRRQKSYCLTKDHLQNEGFEIDINSPVEDPYCLDRNFRAGVDAAHAKVLEKFGAINIHHILYWSQPGESFIDYDDKGTLNPADFLIENSARSGNGKVKFDAAQGPQELREALKKVLQRLDQHALQRVEITVTPAGESSKPTYTAVSASDFPSDLADASDQRFDLKILYLKTGTNAVRVDYYYADATVTENLRVEVAEDFVSSTAMQCVSASSSFTVDGDRKDYPYCLNRDKRDKVPPPPPECRVNNKPAECTCAAPKGDGFLPFPDEQGNIRVYRNADATNEEFEDQSQFAQVERFGTNNGDPDPSKLRIQGGTGNCGVIGLQPGAGPKMHEQVRLLSLSLLLFPAALLVLVGCALAIRRSRFMGQAFARFVKRPQNDSGVQRTEQLASDETRRNSP